MARTAKVPSVVATANFFVRVFIFVRGLEGVRSIYRGGRKGQDFRSIRSVQKLKQVSGSRDRLMALGPLLVFTLNVLSAVVAFLTSYYAYKFRHVAENPVLDSIAFGFMMLGVGLLIEAGTSAAVGQTVVTALLSRTLAVVETFAYLSIQMVAYLIFAVGYAM